MIETKALEYLALQSNIERLEIEAGRVKDEIKTLVAESGVPVHKFEACTVTTVKGRVTEKLDRGKLVAQGVSAEVLEKATVRIEFVPYLRITQ